MIQSHFVADLRSRSSHRPQLQGTQQAEHAAQPPSSAQDGAQRSRAEAGQMEKEEFERLRSALLPDRLAADQMHLARQSRRGDPC